MNANLIQQQAAYKSQALSSFSDKHERKSNVRSNDAPRKKPRLESPAISKNPLRFKWIKLCVDRLRKRYQKVKKPITLEDLIKNIRLELDPAEKNWLFNALKENVKCHFDYEKKRFSFKPTYEMHSKNDLLSLLQNKYENGLGGILLDDVNECLLKGDEVVKELEQEALIKTIVRSDKRTVLFYRDTSVEHQVDDCFKEVWNMISVKEINEGDIESYLKRVGITLMSNLDSKSMQPKKRPVKRKRKVKMLNSHLTSDILKEFD